MCEVDQVKASRACHCYVKLYVGSVIMNIVVRPVVWYPCANSSLCYFD